MMFIIVAVFSGFIAGSVYELKTINKRCRPSASHVVTYENHKTVTTKRNILAETSYSHNSNPSDTARDRPEIQAA
jgi:hypothetical protein